MAMNIEQEDHLLEIKQGFIELVDKKYRNGQKEHGGNLWDRDVVKDAECEAIDLVTYILTANAKQVKAVNLLVSAVSELFPIPATQSARNKIEQVICLLVGKPKIKTEIK